MLPDFPKLKDRLAAGYLRFLRTVIASEGPAGKCSQLRMHEGRDGALFREDGSREETTPKRLQVSMSLQVDEFPELTPGKLKAKYEQLGRDMAREQWKMLVGALDRACEASGNAVDAGCEPFSAEMWLEMLDKLDVEFDSNGRMRVPACLINPSMEDRLRTELQRIDTEPGLRRRVRELEARKRREWLDREADRKLVG